MTRLRRSAASVVRGVLALCLPAALLVGALPSDAAAQAVAGTLLGNVRDESAAAVPGATVTAIEVNTSISRTAVSNETGYYIFSNLKDGTYRVEAELQGFKKFVREGVEVDVNTTVRVDVALAVGNLTETVTVAGRNAGAADRPHRHRAHHRRQAGHRDAAGLQPQLPGHPRHRAGHHAAASAPHSQFFNSQDSLSTQVNGQSRLANNVQIEGLDNNHKTGLLTVLIPPADALETVSVSTSNYDAEFGRSGGAVTNVTLKSGTNNFKGSVFYFGNTEATNASDYFSHLKPPTKFSQGGFTLGGPIIRNKFFFFGDYQRTDRQSRLRRPRHGADDADAQRRLRGIVDQHLRPDHGRPSTAPTACRLPTSRFPPNRISPMRAEHPDADARAQHSRRGVRPGELPAVAGAREDDQRLRREAQLHTQRQEQPVVPLRLAAAGGVRPGPVRRCGRSGQRRVRGHGHQRHVQHGGQLDARLQLARSSWKSAAG